MRRGSSGIREWEVIEEITHVGEDVTVDGRTMRVGAKLEVKRPVFNDGNKGRPVLELTIYKDSWTFRFRVPREGEDEASTAMRMLGQVVEQIPEGRKRLEAAWSGYEKQREEDKQKRIRDHEERDREAKKKTGRSNKGAGQGLGKFSRPGKTKRSRAKRRGESRA